MSHSLEFNEYINFIKKHFNDEYDINKCNNDYIQTKLDKKRNNVNNEDIEINIGKYIKLIIGLRDDDFVNSENIQLLYEKENMKI